MGQVRTHTRRTSSGRTTTVRRHDRDPAVDQRKRDQFERRVLRERQEAANPDAYPAKGTPGQRKRRASRKPVRAKRHIRKAARLWRRHKVKAALFAGLALGELGAWAAARGYAKGKTAWQAHRKRQARKHKTKTTTRKATT